MTSWPASLKRGSGTPRNTRTSWNDVVQASFLLHRSQRLDDMKQLFAQRVHADIPRMEYALVDGYSSEGKFIEIEVTAVRSA